MGASPGVAATHVGYGSIVSPAPLGALQQEDDVVLHYKTPFVTNNSTQVFASVYLSSLLIGQGSAALGPGGNVTFSVHVVVPGNVTSGYRELVAAFTYANATSYAQTTVNYVGGPENAPPVLSDLAATYVIGVGPRVSGNTSDDEGVRSIHLDWSYGSAVLFPPRNASASWSAYLPGMPTRLGPHAILVTAVDAQGARTSAAVVVEVVAEWVVIRDEAIDVRPGLHVEPENFSLPARILSGFASTSCEGFCVGTVDLVLQGESASTCRNVYAGAARTAETCGFRTDRSGGDATVAWAQANGQIRLLVAGWRV